MQDVHSFLESGDIHHPPGSVRVPDSDFPCARADIVEGLPIIGLHCEGTADSAEWLMGTRAEARFAFISEKAEFASDDLLDV